MPVSTAAKLPIISLDGWVLAVLTARDGAVIQSVAESTEAARCTLALRGVGRCGESRHGLLKAGGPFSAGSGLSKAEATSTNA